MTTMFETTDGVTINSTTDVSLLTKDADRIMGLPRHCQIVEKTDDEICHLQ